VGPDRRGFRSQEMQEEVGMMEPLEISCPHCHEGQLFITGIIAAFILPAPDIFAIDCNKCGCRGSGYQRNESEGWQFTWDEGPRSTAII
jgi:uncharacterized protein (DUF983 family)